MQQRLTVPEHKHSAGKSRICPAGKGVEIFRKRNAELENNMEAAKHAKQWQVNRLISGRVGGAFHSVYMKVCRLKQYITLVRFWGYFVLAVSVMYLCTSE